jgi:transcriptional regulator with XRE-family HTH domain
MTDFGAELRRLRVAAGISLARLAAELNYSKGHLSKIETGQKPANEQLARRADVVLGAGGSLAALIPATERNPPESTNALVGPNRRDILTLGSALLLPLAIGRADAEAATEDEDTERHYREQFDLLRKRGQRVAPGFVLRSLVMELCTVVELAEAARHAPTRARLAILAARYAEYAGWMAQEAGDNESARQWTRWSASVASRAGDLALAAYTMVREAELAMYEHNGARTVELARLAQQQPHTSARVRGLAAHREAQGHALLGDHHSCQVALSTAETLLHEPNPNGPGGPALGSTTVYDLGLAVTGWCLYDLGRPKHAAESLERVLTHTVGQRAQALFGARLALAYEATGDLDRMCEVAAQVIDTARPLGSATVHTELRTLTRVVARHHNYRPARHLQVEINATLIDANQMSAS